MSKKKKEPIFPFIDLPKTEEKKERSKETKKIPSVKRIDICEFKTLSLAPEDEQIIFRGLQFVSQKIGKEIFYLLKPKHSFIETWVELAGTIKSNEAFVKLARELILLYIPILFCYPSDINEYDMEKQIFPYSYWCKVDDNDSERNLIFQTEGHQYYRSDVSGLTSLTVTGKDLYSKQKNNKKIWIGSNIFAITLGCNIAGFSFFAPIARHLYLEKRNLLKNNSTSIATNYHIDDTIITRAELYLRFFEYALSKNIFKNKNNSTNTTTNDNSTDESNNSYNIDMTSVSYHLSKYAKFLQLKNNSLSTIIPTLEIEFLWILHQLRPNSYREYCMKKFGKVVPHNIQDLVFVLDSEDYTKEFKETEKIWERKFYESYLSETESLGTKFKSKKEFLIKLEDFINVDIEWMKNLQNTLKIDRTTDTEPIYLNRQFLHQQLIAYKKYLFLLSKYNYCDKKNIKKASKEHFYENKIYPTISIDIIWHAHMLNPKRYEIETKNILGEPLNHTPCSQWKKKPKKDVTQFTIEKWKEEFGDHPNDANIIKERKLTNNDSNIIMTSNINRDILSSLPKDIFIHILNLFRFDDVIAMNLVCKFWYLAIENSDTWAKLLKEDFGSSAPNPYRTHSDHVEYIMMRGVRSLIDSTIFLSCSDAEPVIEEHYDPFCG